MGMFTTWEVELATRFERFLRQLLLYCKLILSRFSKPDFPGEAQVTLADITAAKSLGWQPKVSLKEGLRHSIDYIKDHVLTQV
jgi:nucleoside-diphosphate-sugar epimerase